MDTDIINARNFFEDPFISQIDKFGENVITSIRLRDNYHKIDKIRVLICNKSGLKIELSNDSNLTLEAFMEDNFPEEKKYEFVEHIANYFSNQMKRILKDVKQNKSVFNYSYRRANWVLIVIAKFLEINNIDNEIGNFHISDFCEKAEDATDVNSILTKAYQAEVFRKNINSLGLSLVYYITKVYPIIFNISKNNIEIKNIKQKKH